MSVSDSRCLALAYRAQELCQNGQFEDGIRVFTEALDVGTQDSATLSAIFSQLGNTYFYLRDYAKAFAFHSRNLALNRSTGDRLAEGRASGNLGNVLKMLKSWDQAILCLERYLAISRELNNLHDEGRALYNLAGVYHMKGKDLLAKLPISDVETHKVLASQLTIVATTTSQAELTLDQIAENIVVRHKGLENIRLAAENYKMALVLAEKEGDRTVQGRLYGNIGSTLYMLNELEEAKLYYLQRRVIAEELKDKAGERRALANLANCHILTGNYWGAAAAYLRALKLSVLLSDKGLEAQSCHSIGNSFIMCEMYDKAILYHSRHLELAVSLSDRLGQGRACWALTNSYLKKEDRSAALPWAACHNSISLELDDNPGLACAEATLDKISLTLGSEAVNIAVEKALNSPQDLPPFQTPPDFYQEDWEPLESAIGGPLTHNDNVKLETTSPVRSKDLNAADSVDEDDFFSIVDKVQTRRLDEQRCSFTLLPKVDEIPCVTPDEKLSDEIFDLIMNVQANRIDDQRAAIPEPSDDDGFFDMIFKMQNERIHGQRCEETVIKGTPTKPRPLSPSQTCPTVPPVDEDLFSILARLQGNRIDEQRSVMPRASSTWANDLDQLAPVRKYAKPKFGRSLKNWAKKSAQNVFQNKVNGSRSGNVRENNATRSQSSDTLARSGRDNENINPNPGPAENKK